MTVHTFSGQMRLKQNIGSSQKPKCESALLVFNKNRLSVPSETLQPSLSPYSRDQMILGSLLVLSNHRGQVGPAFQAKPDPKFILFWAVRESTPRPVKQAMYTSTLHCCFINPRPGVLSHSTQKYQSVQINKQYLKHVNSLWVLFSTGSNSHQSKHIPPHPPILPPEHSFGKNVQTFVSRAKAEYLK